VKNAIIFLDDFFLSSLN